MTMVVVVLSAVGSARNPLVILSIADRITERIM